MEFEAALLLIGTFLVLAIGFWMAAERPPKGDKRDAASASPELRLKTR